MSATALLVTLIGVGAILWVNYYFFLAARPAAVALLNAGLQRITVEVHGGYSPAVIRVRAGRPVQLDFHRTDSGSCTEEVVIGDFGIRAFLPPGKTTPVQFRPEAPGVYEFACGMGMVRGKLIVE